MRLLKIILVAALVIAIWSVAGKHRLISIGQPIPRSHQPAADSTVSIAGFVKVVHPDGVDPRSVFIYGAINRPSSCPRWQPSQEGIRSDALATALAAAGIPYVRSDTIGFSSINDSDVEDRLVALQNRERPLVFVNGWAKANPSLDDIIAQYNAIVQPATKPSRVY
ncbi:MAG: hypothetical protein ABSE59_04000 [Opitutaceae bacterium]|jgi:hypothetical protein